MRDREFYINSIKMDLMRVVTATGDINRDIPLESVLQFINHALVDFTKFDPNQHQTDLKDQLTELKGQLSNLNDPVKRLRFAEDVLTIRCRLC